jgi:hypothetical protein
MIHEDLSHGLGGKSQEMSPALPLDGCFTGKLQIDFVNQRGRLERMRLSFPSQISRGKRPEFGVDFRKQLLAGMAISWFDFLQE